MNDRVYSPKAFLRLSWGLLALWLGNFDMVRAADGWPEGYSIAENTTSPNGRYGVLIPSRDVAPDKAPNTLVDLKSHRRIAVIQGVHYAGENHSGLSVEWAADSSWCAATFEARYGFATITLVELKSGTQSDLGKYIQKELDAGIVKSGGSGGCYGSARFRVGPGQTVLARGTGLTNPKSFEGQRTDYSLFIGTFDLATHHWTHSQSRPIDNFDPFETAFDNDLATRENFNSDDDYQKSLDDRLNDVYGAIRVILPAERFAAVKKEQIAWLKRFEATASGAKKCEMLRVRIQELRKYVW